MFKQDGYIFEAPSHHKLKKYDVYDSHFNYIVSFGGKHKDGTPYSQYKDQIGFYSEYDHNDSKRKERYYKRHGLNVTPLSAKYFSHRYLW